MDVRGYNVCKNVRIVVVLVWIATVTGLQDWTKLQLQNLPRKDLCKFSPDACRNVTQLITSKGYPCEEHSVKTEDGYILGVQRIPHGKASGKRPRPVVFLQHGLLASSTNWVTNLANESFGFLLADAGFDVWLGNSRGNTYSTKHTTLSPYSKAFWAWSWDEMAKYDLPVVLEYILKHTGQQNLYYIGHSQGTLIAFSAFSQNQRLAEKVKLFVALGPVTGVAHLKSPVKYMSHLPDEFLYFLFGRRDFLPNDWLIKILDYALCVTKVTKFVCDDIIFLLAGYDIHNLNQTRLPVYIAHSPAGTAVQDVVHFAQMIRHKNYGMYDYGSAVLNKKHYGQATPPAYNVTNMKTPVVLFYAENDWLATPQDVKIMIPKLRNLRGSYLVTDWNHLDFVWAYDAKNVIYDKIIQMLKDDISRT